MEIRYHDIRNNDIKNAVKKQEIYRYLGYGINRPDETVEMLVENVFSELVSVIRPKSCYRIYDCKVCGDSVYAGETEFKSKALSGNLVQCEKLVFLAATIGLEADKLMQKYEVVNMAKASIVQACGAACIETYCDLLQEKIKLEMQEKSGKAFYLRPRFSPGYGDFALETQKDIFNALDCTKRIGLTLTQSLLMYPTKSVTALIGLSANSKLCHVEKCQNCSKTECEFKI